MLLGQETNGKDTKDSSSFNEIKGTDLFLGRGRHEFE